MRALALILLALPASAQEARPGLRELPEPRSGRAVLFSSRDRSGGNVDHGHYMAAGDAGEKVLAACRGPGRITRLWSANPTGGVRIVLDGRVAWEGPFAALLGGAVPGFRPPLAGRGTGGGFLSLVPMPFLNSCVVIADPEDPGALYYQVGVELRPEHAAFDPAHPGLHAAETWALLDPGFPRDAATVTPPRRVTVRDAAATLFETDRAVEIVELRLRPVDAGFEEDWVRRIWVEVQLAAEPTPSVQAPLGDLFGVAFDGDGIETLAVHGLGAARVLRLPMPLPGGGVVRLVPTDALDRDREFVFDVAHRPLAAGARRLPLRASFQRATNVAGVPFTVVHLEDGRPGHYVGAFLALAGASGQGVTFLEGDEAIAVDGEDPPGIQGTGTEDDLNGAWYFRGGTFGAPWHALATLDERRGRVAVARFRGPDPVPFHGELQVTFEHGGTNDAPGSDYAATAFWYGGPCPATVPAATRRAWSRPQGAAAPLELTFAPAVPRVLDPTLPEQALLCGRRVLVEVPGRPPRIVTVDAEGHGLAANEAATIRVSPWLPSIRTFRVVGPFRPSAPRAGVDDEFGPERGWAADMVYDDVVGDGPRGWRELPEPGTWTGYVDLDPLFAPNDEVVAYAACTVVSPRDQDATLVLGSDDAVKVFLDGRPVHRHVGVRGSSRDQDRIELRLLAGAQTLLIKVEDYRGGFGFHARFERAEGLTFRAR